MSYIYLLEREGEFSAESFADIPQSVLSKLSLTDESLCSNGKEMGFSPDFQSGTISEHSTESLGKDSLISSREDFLVKESVSLEKDSDLKTREAAYGERWPVWFAKWDHDSCAWKTAQPSLFEDSEPSSVIWPKWGTMRNGECFHVPTPRGLTELRSQITKGIESTCLRYPTPRKNDPQKRGDFNFMDPRNGLPAFIRRYPTPQKSDAAKWNHMTEEKRKEKGQSVRLINVLRSEYGVPTGGKQSPEFTEWLMGWPIGWTDLKPLETDKFQRWLELHGIL